MGDTEIVDMVHEDALPGRESEPDPDRAPRFPGSAGKDSPVGRPGQPCEVAPCFLFLACENSSYMAGQVLHPNGGIVVNG